MEFSVPRVPGPPIDTGVKGPTKIVDPNQQRFISVALAFHKFGELFERADMRDQLAERVHVAGVPTTVEASVNTDPEWRKLRRITTAVELYVQECFGVDWSGKQVSFHKFAELFERNTAMDQLVKRGRDPQGLLLVKLLALVNAYARDIFGVDLQLMVGEVK